MPFVPAGEAMNLPVLRLSEAADQLEALGGRVPLIGLPGARCVLLRWQPGTSTDAHRHPHALELFLILEGELRAWLESDGGIDEILAGPGALMLAQPGRSHRFEVYGTAPVLLLAFVAPNEDRPDEMAG